jgi:hypothetical protein
VVLTVRRSIAGALVVALGGGCALIFDIQDAGLADAGVDANVSDVREEDALHADDAASVDLGVRCGERYCPRDAGCCVSRAGSACAATCAAASSHLTCDDPADCPANAPCCFRVGPLSAGSSACAYPCDASLMCDPTTNDCNNTGLKCLPLVVPFADGGYYACQASD